MKFRYLMVEFHGEIMVRLALKAPPDAIDAYIITKDDLKAGQIVACEPVGMLEVTEGDEIDHKILARMAGRLVEVDSTLIESLQNFIYGIFSPHPEVKVRVGRSLSRQEAVEYIERHTIE